MPLRTGLGVEIGHAAVRLVYLQASGKRVSVAGHAAYPLDDNRPPAERLGEVAPLINRFMRENRIAVTDIYLAVPRDWAVLRLVSLPLAVKENLRETLGYELDKYVPFPVEQACYDFRIVAEDKAAGTMAVLLVVVKRESVAPLFTLGGPAGGALAGLEITSSALANCLGRHKDGGRPGPQALLFAGAEGCELILIEGGQLAFSRSIPLGRDDGRHVAAIRQGLQGLLKAVGAVPEEGLPLMAAADEGLLEQLQSAGAWEGFSIQSGGPELTGLPSREFMPAYGLALKGLGPVAADINLLPEEYRKKASRAGLYLSCGLAALLIVLLLAWGGGYLYQQQHYLERLDAAAAQLEEEVQHIKRMETEHKTLQERFLYLNGLRAGDTLVLYVLRELTDLVPDSAWLRRLTYADGGVEIEGYADAASDLIPVLEGSPLFRDVAFLAGITKGRDGKETFRIGFKLAQEAGG